MTKKALLVAVDHYEGLARDLRAPVKEMYEWEKMLREKPYHFEVTPLRNEEATRSSVLDALEELLRDAKAGDEIIFAFFGHGTTARGWRTRMALNDQLEHALVMHPKGERNLQNAVITGSDMSRIFREQKPPLGTDITFVIESCFAEDFYDRHWKHILSHDRDSRERTAVPLFAPSPVSRQDRLRLTPVVPLSYFATKRPTEPIEQPVLFAASGAEEFAYELRTPHDSRLLFSEKALALLKSKSYSFMELREAIKPLDPELRQTPTLVGNEPRWIEPFPTKWEDATAPAPGDDESTPKHDRLTSPPSVAKTSNLTVGQPSFDIRILGLCCFVKAVDPSTAAYTSRLIMPFDDIASGPKRHFAFVEVARDDMDGEPTGDGPATKYRRTMDPSGVEYWRWHLDGQRITIDNGERTPEIVKSNAFRRRVPVMTVLNPDLTNRPRSECFAEVADRRLFAAFLDIPGGTVTTGRLDEGETIFRRPSGPPSTWGPQRTPQTVILTVPLTTAATALVIPATAVTGEITIPLKAGSSILIGNAREEDITGSGSYDTPPEHFALLYKLALSFPVDAPLPVAVLAPIDSCSPTDWP